jgi:ubiquinone/menaquinone biosynthesis C-methylase UbiE
MDEGLPPFIRDRRWFMYLFFWYWFKGKKVSLYMDFKKIAWGLSEEEFANCYRELDCRATDRRTDLNNKSIKLMLQRIDPGSETLLDVGCGRGYWLKLLQDKTSLRLSACDVLETLEIPGIEYTQGTIESLPYPDKSFDIVTCHHTIEHIRDIQKAVNELKRVARKQIMVVTPRQRYFYYTLDLHLHFFPVREYLTSLFGVKEFECTNCNGDWCYIARL